MFKNMKIGIRMGLGFIFVLALMVAIVLIGLNGMTNIEKKLDRIVKVNNVRAQLANDMMGSVREVSIALRNIFLARDIANINEMKNRIAEERKKYDEALRKIEELTPKENKEAFEMIVKIKAAQDTSRQLNNKVIELATENKLDEAIEIMNKEARPSVRKWVESVHDLIHHQEERTQFRYNEAIKSYVSARTYMFIIGAVAIALAIAISILLTLSITRPLGLGVNMANKIASGDLTVNLSTNKRRDEIGVLLQSFEQMAINLREQTREILEGVNVLSTSVSEISTTVTQFASSAQETASSVVETTTTMEELRQTARVSSEKANYVSESSQKAVNISDEGKKATEATVEEIKLIREQMESVAGSIVRLSEQSQTIGDIITTVNDIADQSNLLAVNASIEATKAGEQGKGFTVVAQEVKSLAEQSKQATAQVRTILNDIQKAISAAVMSTEQGSKAVESGVKKSDQAGESIRAISNSVREAAQAAIQIAASSQQQMTGIDQVASAMENIKLATTQNLEGSRQLETASTNLNELGQKLKQLIERYKV
jgi:methyl-accepting chemotaxis protein